MSFGDIISAWIREQVNMGKLPKSMENGYASCSDVSSLTDYLCDAIRTAQDDTPIQLLAAHFGYALHPFEGGGRCNSAAHDGGDSGDGSSTDIHC